MERSMEKEGMIGLMDPIMMENGKTIKLMDLVPINGQMVEDIQVNGWIII